TVTGHAVNVAPAAGPPTSVVFPPAAFTPNPTGWDAIPTARPGEVWRAAVTLTAPWIEYRLTLTAWSTPAGGPGIPLAPVWESPPVFHGNGTPQTIELAATLAGDTP